MSYEYSILMLQLIITIVSIYNGWLMHKFCKSLSKREINMNEFEKSAKESIESEIRQHADNYMKNIGPSSDNQGYDSDEELSVNPFVQTSGTEYPVYSIGQTAYDTPRILHGYDNEYSGPPQNELGTTNGGNAINIPIITNDEDMPEDEGSMLNRLLYLSEFLVRKSGSIPVCSQEEWEDIKWETINETYCLITVDLPRYKADIVRRYFFGKLVTTYVKKDNTYYSKVAKGSIAKDVILDLIMAYPWDNPDLVKVALGDGKSIDNNSEAIKEKKHLLRDVDKLTKALNDLKDDIKLLFK